MKKRTETERRKISTRRHGTQTVVIFWGRRHPDDVHKVAFACWYCGKEHQAWDVTAKGPRWDGLNEECRRKVFLEVIILPSGAAVRRDTDHPRSAWLTCPGCPPAENERYLRKCQLDNTFSGLCKRCG